MDKREARLEAGGHAGLWNGGAGHAWVEEQELVDRMFGPIEDLLLEAVAPGQALRALDVGCGTGGTTLALARRLGPGARCTGIDISAPMVEAARRRAANAGAGLDFVCADAARHAFVPGSFDLVVSRFGVMFFDDPAAAFARLRRAARAGGELRFVAWRGAEENAFMTAAERAARPLLPDLPRRAPDEAGQFGLAREARVRDVLAQAGWEHVGCVPVDLPCAFPEAELDGYLARMGPVGRALETAGGALRERVLARVRTAFDPWVAAGAVRFTAACWLVTARAPAGAQRAGSCAVGAG